MPYVGAVLMLGEWVDFEYSVNGKMYQFSLLEADLCHLQTS